MHVHVSDLPTPKSEKAGGGLEIHLAIEKKKPGDFLKTSPEFITLSISRWKLIIST